MAVPIAFVFALIIIILVTTKCTTGNYEHPSSNPNKYSNSSAENSSYPKNDHDRFHRRRPQKPTSYFIPENTSSELPEVTFKRYRSFEEHGGATNPACYGNLQSPINLSVRDPSHFIAPRLKIMGFTTKPAGVTVTNTGYSIVIKWLPSKGLPAAIVGGVLRLTYIVDSAHFHWGRTDSSGSEHLIYNRPFSLELHVVCFNSKYGSFANAKGKEDGLAVIAVLYRARKGAASLPFIKDLPLIMESGSSVNTEAFALSDLMKQRRFKYFSYKGSLTSPDCSEGVTWIVSNRTLAVNPDDLTALRYIKDEHGHDLVENSRPIQRSNHRPVTFQST